MRVKPLILLSLMLSSALSGRADDIATDSVTILAYDIPSTPETRELAEALQAAMPYAEAGILADRSCFSGSLGKIDNDRIEFKIMDISPLIPYSDRIAERVDTLKLFMEITDIYERCVAFDNQPYSENLIDGTQKDLLKIFNMGKAIFDKSQIAEIDSLYEFSDKYLPAVEAFDNLIKSIDAEVELFRDNEQGDKLCTNEIERIMGESGEAIKQINEFRYLSDLLTRYRNELKASPRSLTPEIREQLAKMLSGDDTPDSVTESDNDNEPEPINTKNTENDQFE